MSSKPLNPFLAVPEEVGEIVTDRLKERNLLDRTKVAEVRDKKLLLPLRKEIILSRVFREMDTRGWMMGFMQFKTKRSGESKKRRNRRTLLERAKSIFKFIEMQPEPFPKSEMQKIGLNPETAEKWLRLIEYIQGQPMIKVTRMGSSLYIERLENKYLSMLRKRVFDSSLSLKERSRTMDDYVNALMTLERAELGRIKR